MRDNAAKDVSGIPGSGPKGRDHTAGVSVIASRKRRQILEVSLCRNRNIFLGESDDPELWSGLFRQSDPHGIYIPFAIDAEPCDENLLAVLPEHVLAPTVRSCEDVMSVLVHTRDEGRDWAGALIFKRHLRDPKFAHGIFRFPASALSGVSVSGVLLEREGFVSVALPPPVGIFLAAMRRNLNRSPFETAADAAMLARADLVAGRLVFPASKFNPVIDKAFEVMAFQHIKRGASA